LFYNIFRVIRKQKGGTNLLLQNEKTMLVVSPVGGNVERWQHGNTEVFFPRGNALAGNKLRISGGMHQCLPNLGVLPDTVASYGLPQHGPLRNTLCSGILLKDPNPNRQTHGGASMRFEIPGSRNAFPWNLYGSIEIAALPNGFRYETDLVCTSFIPGKRMPVCCALHSFFNTPNGGCVEFPDGRREFRPMAAEVLTTGPVIDIRLNGIGKVVMKLEHGYRQAVAWSDSPEYFCVEPTMGDGLLFGTPNGTYLSHQEHLRLSCSFEFQPE